MALVVATACITLHAYAEEELSSTGHPIATQQVVRDSYVIVGRDNSWWLYSIESGSAILGPLPRPPERFDQCIYFYDRESSYLLDLRSNTSTPIESNRTFIYERYGIVLFSQDNLYGYMSISGEIILDPEFAWGSRPGPDSVGIEDQNTGNFSILDYQGNTITTGDFIFPQPYTGNLAWVFIDNGEQAGYGCIDRSGRIVVPPRFVDVKDFSDAVAPAAVSQANQTIGSPVLSWGLINRAGDWIVDPIFLEMHEAFSDGRVGFAFRAEGDLIRWQFMDWHGNIINPKVKYDIAFPFVDGNAVVCLNGAWGVIDLNGQWIINPIYTYVTECSGGFAGAVSRNADGSEECSIIRLFDQEIVSIWSIEQ